jgi:ATP-dependent RNA helicase DBP3
MAKRSHEEVGTGVTPKRLKTALDGLKESNIDSGYASASGNHDVQESEQVPKRSKEERRALKRARKEEKKLKSTFKDDKLNTPDETSSLSKAERKALKQTRKAERKALTVVDACEESVPQSPDDVIYREHNTLTALPQAEIDAFVSDKQLTIEDSLNQGYRPIVSFKHLPSGPEIDRSQFASFSTPTPIQAACWPYLFAGRDVVGVAETGSGKTFAFGVPCVRYIARLGKKERRHIKACIVSPTRELAMQIYEQLSKLATPAGLKVTCVYGGVNKDVQRETISGTHILVATPGRLNDFLGEGAIDLSNATYLVLDEADRMLDTGFEEEVRKIVSSTAPTARQTLMFTATWPQSVRNLASTFMNNPVKVTIGDNASGELRANTRVSQVVEVIEEREKQIRLIDLLKQYQTGKNKNDRILVFCLYKKEATRIEEFIRRKGFPVAGIHGDLSQQKRTESLEAFKQGSVPLLVATDVAARGLDIPAVKLVINVTFPLTVEDYVHRIGRTGRAGQDGKAITLFTTNEKALSGALINVLKAANQPVPDELLKFGTTVKKKTHDAYGAFYKDVGEMKKATKITFD